MPKYSLTGVDKRCLTLELEDGQKFSLPLAGSMKIKELKKLVHMDELSEVQQFDFQVEFLAKYMGEAVVDDLTQDEVKKIYQMWIKASNNEQLEDGGPDLGESSAS